MMVKARTEKRRYLTESPLGKVWFVGVKVAPWGAADGAAGV